VASQEKRLIRGKLKEMLSLYLTRLKKNTKRSHEKEELPIERKTDGGCPLAGGRGVSKRAVEGDHLRKRGNRGVIPIRYGGRPGN